MTHVGVLSKSNVVRLFYTHMRWRRRRRRHLKSFVNSIGFKKWKLEMGQTGSQIRHSIWFNCVQISNEIFTYFNSFVPNSFVHTRTHARTNRHICAVQWYALAVSVIEWCVLSKAMTNTTIVFATSVKKNRIHNVVSLLSQNEIILNSDETLNHVSFILSFLS